MEEQDSTLLHLCTYDERTPPFEPQQNDFQMRNGKGRNNRLQFVVELLQKKVADIRNEGVVDWSDEEWEERFNGRPKLRVTQEDLEETVEICNRTDPSITFAEPTAEELELLEQKKRLVQKSKGVTFPKDLSKKSGKKLTQLTNNFPNVNFSKDFEEQEVVKIQSQRSTRSPPYCPAVSVVLSRVPDSVLRNLRRNRSEFHQVQVPPPSPPEIVKRWIPSTPESAKPSTPQSLPTFVKATPPPVNASLKRKPSPQRLPLAITSPKRKPNPEPLPREIASPKRKRKTSPQPLPLAIASPKRKPSPQPPLVIASPKRKPSPQPLPLAITSPKRKPYRQPLPLKIASPKRKPVATPVIPMVKPKSQKAKNYSHPFTDIQNSYTLTPTSPLTSSFDTVAYEQFASKTPFPGLKLTFAPIYDTFLYTPPKSKKPRTG